MFSKITDWSFLNEPAYRWFIFTGVMLLIFISWGIIIGYMKKVA